MDLDKKDFADFYLDQVSQAELVLLSNLEELSPKRIAADIENIRAQNGETVIYQKDWRKLEGQALLDLGTCRGIYGGSEGSESGSDNFAG